MRAVVAGGVTVYAGGEFTSIGGETRNAIAALDASTGLASAGDPDDDNPVSALAATGDTVYVAGDFTKIGGQARNYVAALDAGTGQATGWNPDADKWVYALDLSGDTVYVGGWFSNIDGQLRSRIAALDAATGKATAWSPKANSPVYALVRSGGTVYAGGEFTKIGGQERNRIAALDASTGLATGWNPDASDVVRTLAESAGSVYAGGDFGAIGVQPAARLASIFRQVPGTIIIAKETLPAGGSGFGFSQDMDGTGDFALADGGSKTFEYVVAGSYAVTEDDPSAVPGDYDLTGLVCVDSDAGGSASTTNQSSRTATINLDPGETVTCTFTNTLDEPAPTYWGYLPLILRASP